MKTAVFIIAAAAMSLLSPAAATIDTPVGKMRKDHPRIFFNSDTWPQIKARAQKTARPALKKLLKEVDSYPDDPKCSGMGPSKQKNRAIPINSVKEWGVQAAECALAWRFTGKKNYLEKAKKMLEVSIAAYHEAYRNGREVNWFSNSRIMAFCAYDWIYEALTPDERRAIIVPFVQHVEDAHPVRGKKNIIRRNTSDYRTGYYGARSMLWYSGLAAYGDGFCDELALRHLTEGKSDYFKLLDFRAKSATDDGGLVSATAIYSMGAYPYMHFNFLHTWKSAFGENIAGRYSALGLFPNWVFWTWIRSDKGARQFGFGDDYHIINDLPTGMLYRHMTQCINLYRDSDPASARLAATLCEMLPEKDKYLGSSMPLYPFVLDLGDCGVKPFTEKELRNFPVHARHFKELGQFLMRSAWDEDATYCAFTAGASFRHHKHHDENNFTIFKHDFLALDSGSRGDESDYNLRHYYTQTVAHNCMLIHAPGEPLPQSWGIQYRGKEGKTNYGGMNGNIPAKVLAFETGKEFTYIASDVTRSYGKKCDECVRQFVFLLPDFFVVYDRVGVKNPEHRKEWLLHFKNEPEIQGKLLKADSDKGRLFCETLLPADAELKKVGGKGREFWANDRNWELSAKFLRKTERWVKEAGCGPYFGAWRLEVSPGAPRKSDRFLHVLTAADTSVKSPVKAELACDEEFDGVTLTVPGYKYGRKSGTLTATLRFRRDGEVGGNVRISFKSAGSSRAVEILDRPFTRKVQPQQGVFPENTEK